MRGPVVPLLVLACFQLTSGIVAVVLTTSGQQCHFPFVYQSISYSRCITIDSLLPWCATTEEEVSSTGLNMNNWGYCADAGEAIEMPKGCPIQTEAGTTCKLTFMYDGEVQTQCIWRNNKKPWCLDTRNEVSNCIIDETKDGEKCHFPTTYIDGDGTEYVYDQCTRKNARYLWCATDANPLRYKDGSSNWGECYVPNCYMGEE